MCVCGGEGGESRVIHISELNMNTGMKLLKASKQGKPNGLLSDKSE